MATRRNEQVRTYSENLVNVFDDRTFSDVRVTCGAKLWHLHRVLLSAHSPWFAAACGGSFKESHTGEIEIHQQNPAIVEVVLHTIYAGPSTWIPCARLAMNRSDNDGLTFLIDLYRTANYFQVHWLEKEIVAKFSDLFQTAFVAAGTTKPGCDVVYPSLSLVKTDHTTVVDGTDGPFVVHFVEAVKYACSVFGTDSNNELLVCLRDLCVASLEILISSRCWAVMGSAEKTSIFVNRVLLASSWGLKQHNTVRKFSYKGTCWICEETLEWNPSRRDVSQAQVPKGTHCDECWELARSWFFDPPSNAVVTFQEGNNKVMHNENMDNAKDRDILPH
ncbi:hypothetical protein BT63DRAFT_430413 [Microthyrium microscopicum]|uniref:BTB domain-containing protein n=1 Tax=Microthyrium microscopicum TaxID=703497 RepID=A0A6A6TWQ3_9PEZI|nr:hypothetical protein BT63DRAFT_430413 [Microthyrium microscopicum]